MPLKLLKKGQLTFSNAMSVCLPIYLSVCDLNIQLKDKINKRELITRVHSEKYATENRLRIDIKY